MNTFGNEPWVRRFAAVCSMAAALGMAARGGGGADAGDSAASGAVADGAAKPAKIVLQTDWYPQPEHGGFYQALANGFYAEEGLDVKILPGGPNTLGVQKVAQDAVQFAIGRSDDVIIAASRGVPITIVASLMQKDPQALMFHKESGITDFKDLDGRAVMAAAGSAFIEIMQRKLDINVSVLPLDYGMSRFLAHKQFVQQCFITNEPYYVAREGANPGTLLLADMGFRPYRVWYASRSFARNNPDVVEAFTRASIRGWSDYLNGDPDPANTLISAANPKMTPAFVQFSRSALIKHKLVTGDSGDPAAIGSIDPARIQEQIEQLQSISMLEGEVTLERVLRTR